MHRITLALIFLFCGTAMTSAETLRLYAAGSLKRALGDAAKAYEATSGDKVEAAFGPSGLMRKRIESGETAHVFASANMKHPKALNAQGKSGPVVRFARNTMCAIAQADMQLAPDSLLDVLLDEKVRLGTSTPKADPSGDYAWEIFGKADKIEPGAFAALAGKALKLTGGKDTKMAPKGRNQYGWVMSEKKADIFLTYCTNAVLAKKDVPGLQIVPVPDALSVGADYGLTVMNGAPSNAQKLADFILSDEGQAILAGYGFETVR